MSLFLQLLLDGLATGAIYAALALALVLIHRSTGIVNFGQGEMATFTAFVAWQLMAWGLPPWIALPAVALLAFALGALVFKFLVQPVVGESVETVVVATLGVFITFQALCLWLWGPDQREFFKVFPATSWAIGNVHVAAAAAGVLFSVTALSAALVALFRFTRLGLGMRAAAAERENSLLVGIPVQRMLLLGWGLSAVIGFVAATLVAPKLFLSPTMMLPVLLYSLAAATIGGWNSPAGAIVGGLLVGVFESLGSSYVTAIGSELRLAIPVLLTLLLLLVKPAGLFSRAAEVRA